MQATGFERSFRDYLELCKPRVVLLMLLTVVVGMYLATPHGVPTLTLWAGLLGIGCAASCAAAINHVVDQRIDAIMARTNRRPIVRGSISTKQAIFFALCMGLGGLSILVFFVNTLTATLTFITIIGYAGIYTGYLKRATPQNIVIGGLAGAAPPLLGWTAVTNHCDPQALLLVLIIFIWTPPHFWALAIFRFEDYKHAKIPMLPVTHGIHYTKVHILLYTVLLAVVSVLPVIVGMSGMLYLLVVLMLNARFIHWTMRLYRHDDRQLALRTFKFSVVYLTVLFMVMLVDHYLYAHTF